MVPRAGRVALGQAGPAQLRELARGLRILRAGIAVAEIRRQVEAQALGQRLGLRHRVLVPLEARGHRGGGREHVSGVAAAHGLRRVQREVVAQGDERILQRRARAGVRGDVAGGHRRDAEPPGHPGEHAVARAIVALEGALELHTQVVWPEAGEQPAQRRLVVDAVIGAAAQAHEPAGVLLERLQRDRGRGLARIPIVHVGARDDPAQVAPAERILDQQRDVAPVLEVDLHAVDGAQAERLRRQRELHRARDAIVVRERHRPIAQLHGRGRQLVRRGRAVQEREGRVGVELDVWHEHMFAPRPDGSRYNPGVDRLETPRLHLRPFAARDATVVHRVYSDPEVMRYVATGPLADLTMTSRLLRDYMPHQEAWGYSFWAVVERATGTVIGDAGLYRTPIGEVELGYTLGQAWWKGAYATEAAGAWLEAAFSQLGISEVVALAEPANAASLRVLEKLGMRRDGERLAFGRPHSVYRASRRAGARAGGLLRRRAR